MNTEGRVRAERRLAAILAADVAGYSRLIGVDEEGTLHRIRAIRAEVIDPKIAAHHGRLVKTTGDGLLVEFGSVVDALRCATEVQREMVERNSGVVVSERINFRIGVHQGDIVVEDGDIFGDGVNVAARLEGLAESGGICVSARVQEDVAGKLDLTFDDLGEQIVKNIVRPIRAYALSADAIAALPRADTPAASRPTAPPGPRYFRRWIAAGAVTGILIVAAGLWWMWQSPKAPWASATAPPLEKVMAPAVPRLSIVVLPFTNLSNDPDQEYFADGVTDELTTDLSRLSGSFVISRTTAFTYKGKPVNVRQIGRDLGVRYVLEGSVRRAGNQVHVNVQLIDAASEARVWADQFDADRANLAEAQSVITGRLANILRIALVRDAGRRIAEEKSIDPDAQDLVMRGRDWSTRPLSAETLREAQQSFAQALQIDPRSIDAKLGIAGILNTKYINGFSDSPQQDQATAEKLLHEVLDRDPDRADAHAGMGIVLRLRGQLTESKSELETALQLDPNNVTAHRQLGFTLFFLGQPAAAIVEGEDALRRSPRDPVLWGVYQLLGYCRLYLGQFDQAVDFLVKSRAANPWNTSTHLFLAAALAMNSDLDAGKAALQEALKLDPKINSIEFFRQHGPCTASPKCGAAREKTLFAGLRRLGFPEK